MSLLERHLPDEALLAARDGEPLEPDLQSHLEACPLCRERLAAWAEFAERVAGAASPEALTRWFFSLPERPSRMRSYALHLAEAKHYPALETKWGKKKAAAPSSPPESAVPEDWTAGLLETLTARPPVRELGRIAVGRDDEGNPILSREETPWWDEQITAALGFRHDVAASRDELTIDFGAHALTCAVHRAGLQVFLILQVHFQDGTPETVGEATLIPRRGAIRIQPLDHRRGDLAGLAWFRLPPGRSELFLHLDHTARLRIDHLPGTEGGGTLPGKGKGWRGGKKAP